MPSSAASSHDGAAGDSTAFVSHECAAAVWPAGEMFSNMFSCWRGAADGAAAAPALAERVGLLEANPDAGMSHSQRAMRLLKLEGFTLSKQARADRVVPFDTIE